MRSKGIDREGMESDGGRVPTLVHIGSARGRKLLWRSQTGSVTKLPPSSSVLPSYLLLSWQGGAELETAYLLALGWNW